MSTKQFLKWGNASTTKNIEEFKLFDFNRDVNLSAVKELAEIMGESNICMPISVVVRSDGHKWVIDGQHRLKAIELFFKNYEIPFIVLDISNTSLDNDEDLLKRILLANKLKNSWKLQDIVSSRATMGDDLCKKALELSNKLENLRLTHILSLLEDDWKESNVWFKELVNRSQANNQIKQNKITTAIAVNDFAGRILSEINDKNSNSSHVVNGLVKEWISIGMFSIQDLENIKNAISEVKKGFWLDSSGNVPWPSETASKQWKEFFHLTRTNNHHDIWIKNTVVLK